MVEGKVFTLTEVAQSSSQTKPLIIINNSVYDVTSFLNEHPGGEEVLLEQAGKDASEQFEDVGHSTDAREMMKKFKIGELAESDRKQEKPKEKPMESIERNQSGSWTGWILPATMGMVVALVYKLLFSK